MVMETYAPLSGVMHQSRASSRHTQLAEDQQYRFDSRVMWRRWLSRVEEMAFPEHVEVSCLLPFSPRGATVASTHTTPLPRSRILASHDGFSSLAMLDSLAKGIWVAAGPQRVAVGASETERWRRPGRQGSKPCTFDFTSPHRYAALLHRTHMSCFSANARACDTFDSA